MSGGMSNGTCSCCSSASGGCRKAFAIADWTTHPDPRHTVRSHSSSARRSRTNATQRFGPRSGMSTRASFEWVSRRCAAEACTRTGQPSGRACGCLADLDEEIRLTAVAVLGRISDACGARRACCTLADGGRTLFGRQRLAAKTPLLVAVIRSLAGALVRGQASRSDAGRSRPRPRIPNSWRRRGRPDDDRSRPFPQRICARPRCDDALSRGPSLARRRRRCCFRRARAACRLPKGHPTFTFLEDEVVFGREPLAGVESVGVRPASDCRGYSAHRVRADGHAGSSSRASSRRSWRV